MKKFIITIFVLGMIVYALGIAHFPDRSDQQFFSAMMFLICTFGFIMAATKRGERKITI